MKQKYHVLLSKDDRAKIEDTNAESSTPKSIRKRCHVLQLADENIGKPPTRDEIAKRCGVSSDTVYTVIRNYVTKGIDFCLRRRIHETPPRAPIVTGEKEARIIALACREPPAGYARWTVRLLLDKVVELGIMESVGRETIRTTLKKHNSSLT
jgi:transposase